MQLQPQIQGAQRRVANLQAHGKVLKSLPKIEIHSKNLKNLKNLQDFTKQLFFSLSKFFINYLPHLFPRTEGLPCGGDPDCGGGMGGDPIYPIASVER